MIAALQTVRAQKPHELIAAVPVAPPERLDEIRRPTHIESTVQSWLTDEDLVQLLGRINAQLTVYTGLIETARTNNRAGNPVGVPISGDGETTRGSVRT